MPDDDSLYRYRSRRGEMLTDADMEAIFGDDITGPEVEDRESITFESWLAEMIGWAPTGVSTRTRFGLLR